jgi:hypothetical protein
MTRCTGLAWLRRGVIRKDCIRVKAEWTTQRIGAIKENLQVHHEWKGGTKDLGSKGPLCVRNKRATAIGIGGQSSRQLSPLGRGGPTYKTLMKTLELEFVKWANGTSSGFQKMRKWTLQRGRPNQRERKKIDHAQSRSQKCGSTGHSGQFWPTKKRNGWWWEPELTGTLSGSCSGWAPLRREQTWRLESDHRRGT